MALGAAVAALPGLFRAARLSLRHRPVAGTRHQMGLGARDALCAAARIRTDARRQGVLVAGLA